MKKQPTIYMDHAAATPVDPIVLKAMLPFFTDEFYNPSATYSAASAVKRKLEEARAGVAHWLGARASEIIFTAGGTEANNLAIHGVMKRFPKGKILISSIEHESVSMPASGYDCRQVKVRPDGRLDMSDLRQKIDDKTVVVSIVYANNEIGTVQPLRQVATIIAETRKKRSLEKAPFPLYFHTDACQAANYLDLHVSRLDVDLLTLNGGKIYGPKQSGALYVKAGTELSPLIQGGGQERGLRSGTENIAAAIGLAAALSLVQSDRHTESKRLQDLRQQFIQLFEKDVPQAIINGSLKWRLPNNLHVTIPGQDNERLLVQLDQASILAAAGSACSASNETPSHVLKALGLSDAEARASLRFTMGKATDINSIKQVVKLLKEII